MDFVKDWVITQTLGEGAYGEVKLLENKQTGEHVAMKVINASKCPAISKEVQKEVVIHRILKNPHIIKFYGSRSHAGIEYIFLEYAHHGELFDRIEPDIGMPHTEAQRFMKQLLDGVDYLHSKGIAHRDIKPENLLLDEHDNLKISDFGLATIFRAGGKERALEKRCGTLPYVAPEVLLRAYAAKPADIWSCGVVLIAMLGGELPWDKASESCSDYAAWVNGNYTHLSPWCKIDTLPLSLLRRILVSLPSSRYTSEQIRSHKWLSTPPIKDEKHIMKIIHQNLDHSEVDDGNNISLSQLPPITKNLDCEASLNMFLSQPTSLDDMLVSTQLLNTQSSSTQNCMQKLVRRMTRFIVNMNVNEAVEELTGVLNKLQLNWKAVSTLFTVSIVDRRNNQLIFKANIMETDVGTLMDFRLSRGCGLEFKRCFVSIRYLFSENIVPIRR